MKPILFTKENRDKTRTSAKTQTRRVVTDSMTARIPYRVGEIHYLCEPYVIDSAEHTSKRQVKGEYLDDGGVFKVDLTPAEWGRWLERKRPYDVTQARFMYKSLARTFVEITGLRWQWLQDISESDAIAEGLTQWTSPQGKIHYGLQHGDVWEVDPRKTFKRLWDSINAARGHGFDTNPTVVVVEYKLVTP